MQVRFMDPQRTSIWGVLCPKQVLRAETSKYIPQFIRGIYLFVPTLDICFWHNTFHIKYNKTKYDKMSVMVWPLYHPVCSEHIQHTVIISMTDIFWKQERRIKHAILNTTCHDDAFVRGIRRSPANSPHKKDSDAEVWYFLWSGPEQMVE